jgi:hypothetical protein
MKTFPKNDEQVTAEFKSWVLTKPEDETYNYVLNTNCAFAQFLKENDYAEAPRVVPYSWYHTGSSHEKFNIPWRIEDAAKDYETFGSLSDYLNG